MWHFPLLGNLIRKRIKREMEEAFGNNFEEIVLGGAALNKEVEQFLQSIHFRHYALPPSTALPFHEATVHLDDLQLLSYHLVRPSLYHQ